MRGFFAALILCSSSLLGPSLCGGQEEDSAKKSSSRSTPSSAKALEQKLGELEVKIDQMNGQLLVHNASTASDQALDARLNSLATTVDSHIQVAGTLATQATQLAAALIVVLIGAFAYLIRRSVKHDLQLTAQNKQFQEAYDTNNKSITTALELVRKQQKQLEGLGTSFQQLLRDLGEGAEDKTRRRGAGSTS